MEIVHVLQLPIDIKVLISSTNYTLWTWMVARDPELYNWSVQNAQVVVNILTETITIGFVTSKTLFGRPHCTTKDITGAVLPAVTWTDGSCKWYYNGKLHSYDDQPALIVPRVINKTIYKVKEWYQRGKLHRDKLGLTPDCTDDILRVLPAIDDGYKYCWYLDGKLHRECDVHGEPLPAIISIGNPRCLWYKHGVIYKDNDNYSQTSPQIVGSIIESNEFNTKIIGKYTCNYQNKFIHRDNDLPAYVSTTCKMWYQHGMRHRDGDQPASVTIKPTGIEEVWFWNNVCINRYELCK